MKKLVVVIVLAMAATAVAQPAASEPDLDICISRHVGCKTNVLLENSFGLKPVVVGSGYQTGIDFTLEAGLLFNAGDDQGFGGSIGVHWVDEADAIPYVFRGRYRRWLSSGWNADVSPGFMLANVKRGGTGGTLQLSFEHTGTIAFVIDLDVYRSSHDSSAHTVFEAGFGVKFCGLWSLPTTLVTLLFAAALRGSG